MKSIMKNTGSEVARFTNNFALNAQIGYTDARELRIFLGVISQTNPYDENEVMEGIFSLEELERLTRPAEAKRSGSIEVEYKKILKNMMKKNYVEFASPVKHKGKVLNSYRVVFDRIEPLKIDGTAFYKWRVHEDMRPHIKNLQDNFVGIALPKKMRSGHSIRFLILGTAHHNRLRVGGRVKVTRLEIDLEEFRRLLNIQGKYPVFSDLRKRVIEPIVSEINASGLLFIQTYNYLKTGRTITGIEFFLEDGDLMKKRAKQLPIETSEEKKEVDSNSDFVPTEKEENQLKEGQYLAYKFLVEKGCKEGIVYRQIVQKTPSSECKGWEDIYFQRAWKLFESGTKYKQKKAKAGAFIKWWMSGKFKDRHFEVVNDLRKEKKKIKEDDIQRFINREDVKDLSHTQFLAWREEQQKKASKAVENETLSSSKNAGFEGMEGLLSGVADKMNANKT